MKHLLNVNDTNEYFSDQRREARKRKKQHEKDAERGEGCADAQEMAEDDKLLSMPAPEKPHPPQEFDKEVVLAKVSIQNISWLIYYVSPSLQ